MSATALDTLMTPILFLKFGGRALERLRDHQKELLSPAQAY
jgi:hypothetical protein